MSQPLTVPAAVDAPSVAPLLTDVSINGSSITFHLNPALRRLHVATDEFWVRYPEDVDLAAVPDEIRLLPAAYHFAPLAWAFDARFRVPALDERALGSFEAIRSYMRRMYPGIAWDGWLDAERTSRVETAPANEGSMTAVEKSYDAAALFTGGIDSTHTALAHEDERLLLITIWTDRDGTGSPSAEYRRWLDHAAAFAGRLGDELALIETNVTQVIDRIRVTDELRRRDPIQSWWVGVHFGMALTSLAAPLLYRRRIPLLYISSGFTGDQLLVEGVAPDAPVPILRTASSPNVDDHITLGPACVRHDAVRTTRQAKIEQIVRHPAVADGYPARVCAKAQHETGANCGECEKCLRTISSIVVAGGDPRRLGFPRYGPETLHAIRRGFERRAYSMPRTRTPSWVVKQRSARERLATDSMPPGPEADYLRWLADFDFPAYEAATARAPGVPTRIARRLGLAPALLGLRRRLRYATARRAARRDLDG